MQSRYYDPEVGRFVNGDMVEVTVLGQNVLSRNLFGYCYNDPMKNTDAFGFAPKGSEVPPATSGYVPPKGGPKKGRTKDGKTGWVDKNGNVWVPDPSNHGGEHWDVTGKNGYINVGRDGHARKGKGKVNLPKASKRYIEWGEIINGIFVIFVIFLLVFLINYVARKFAMCLAFG